MTDTVTDAVRVSLDTLNNGAAVERFNYELARVLENILDLNTSPTAGRQVQLTMKIKPSEDRTFCFNEIIVTSKLAPIKPVAGSMHVSQSIHGAMATEFNPQQQSIPFSRSAE